MVLMKKYGVGFYTHPERRQTHADHTRKASTYEAVMQESTKAAAAAGPTRPTWYNYKCTDLLLLAKECTANSGLTNPHLSADSPSLQKCHWSCLGPLLGVSETLPRCPQGGSLSADSGENPLASTCLSAAAEATSLSCRTGVPFPCRVAGSDHHSWAPCPTGPSTSATENTLSRRCT